MTNLSTYAHYAKRIGKERSAHPLILSVQCHLSASQREVFDYISDTDRLAEWIPLAKKSYSDDTNAIAPKEVGSVRVIDAGAGKPTLEEVFAFEPPRMIAYGASDESLFGMFTEHLSVITVEPHQKGGSVLTWLAYGKPSRVPPMRWLGRAVFCFALNGGARALKKKFG